ncbi:MAG: MFS transporter [Burkholderiales bacterium]|nr:MFS transporter [Phycisphaerae bacterium]
MLVMVTFSLSVLLYVDRAAISAAAEPIQQSLSLSKKQMGWVLSAFALGYALFQTPGGLLADRYGPRRVLAAITAIWSIFTGLTAAAGGYISLLAVRFLFGAGEAGAFPNMARATLSWIPMGERGIVQGINFSGSRLGAAAAMPLAALMIQAIGWRESFVVLMIVGIAWAIFWYAWFRDDPTEDRSIPAAELEYILTHRQKLDTTRPAGALRAGTLLSSGNVWLMAVQYFCSNFTFFFCLTWLFPNLKSRFDLPPVQAGLYAAAPLVCGAIGNWVSGAMVDRIYRSGRWVASRRVPAVLGYLLAAGGVLGYITASSPLPSVMWFSVAVFGADMTLAPSWSFCIDIGKRHAGLVSGTMNMAGNIGSFLTALAFPYLLVWTGSTLPFFFVAAGLNLLGAGLWLLADPRRALEQDPSTADGATPA